MTDPRFFRPQGPFSLSDMASRIGAESPARDASDILIYDIGELETAKPGDLSLFSDIRYLAVLASSKASVIVTNHALARHVRDEQPVIFAADPRLAFVKAGHVLYPAQRPDGGIDPLARVHETAVVKRGTQIDFGAVIGPDVEIGEDCHIGCHAVLDAGVTVGNGSRIGPHTTIRNTLIGARVEIDSSCSIGGQGFGFVASPTGLLRMLQVGRVVIEDDVEIGANCTIDRGATGDTVIGAGTVIDNLVQIGHNVRLGRHCILSGQSGVAGSTVLGDNVMVGGQAAISDHLVIGSGARIAGKSGVMRNVEPGGTVGGYPAVPVHQWHRQTAGLMRLIRKKSTPGAERPSED
jgi:UDP-3-O-[3-hydroxymyristoyl] glucosamine N-acyltransferase